jgi:hypothetical protein
MLLLSSRAAEDNEKGLQASSCCCLYREKITMRKIMLLQWLVSSMYKPPDHRRAPSRALPQ